MPKKTPTGKDSKAHDLMHIAVSRDLKTPDKILKSKELLQRYHGIPSITKTVAIDMALDIAIRQLELRLRRKK